MNLAVLFLLKNIRLERMRMSVTTSKRNSIELRSIDYSIQAKLTSCVLKLIHRPMTLRFAVYNPPLTRMLVALFGMDYTITSARLMHG